MRRLDFREKLTGKEQQTQKKSKRESQELQKGEPPRPEGGLAKNQHPDTRRVLHLSQTAAANS